MRRVMSLVALVTLMSSVFSAGRAMAQPGVAGRWEGNISILGTQLGIVVVLAADGTNYKATIDIPQQGARGLPLIHVRVEGTKIHFELMGGPGLAVFDGEQRGDTISGTFQQATVAGTFDLMRGAAAAAARAAAAQAAPAVPPPYKEEEVTFKAGSVTRACTLTLPVSSKPSPAVVMITGSGAQNRDEEILGFKVFQVIADHLTRHGVAVLRCDDRGVGGSTGSTSQSTSADFADDTLAGVKYLQARAEIDKTRIGLMGHSEGGLVAPMLAARVSDIAFIILMSGPGLPGEQIMLAQSELVGRAAGRTDEQVRRNQEIQRKMFASVRSGTGWDEVEAMIRSEMNAGIAAMPEAQRKAIGESEKFVEAQVKGQLDGVRTPWFKFFLEFDPATVLDKVKCPTLAIFAEHDVQVAAGPNRAAMEKAFARGGLKNYRIEVFPRANHLYQDSPTGSVIEYGMLKKEFVPGFLDLISTWIGEQAGTGKR
ncbi:MAG: alpha/beta fold hydrolase [Acidobacteria bacterium]|nr:alpha/beta fold hydrolase [Acidobacteriota bacterium]